LPLPAERLTSPVTITGIVNTGIFDVDPTKIKNACMIDMDKREGVLAITFASRKDRFFVIPLPGAQVLFTIPPRYMVHKVLT
jgi:hypothetical protein